jgi:uncharacterized iron-regulated membrane protein
MAYLKRWLRRPHDVWLRKALFQVHLWTGVGIGLYVLVISLSGSAIVFRNELYTALWPGARIVATSGTRLDRDGLKQAARQAYPGYLVSWIFEPRKPDRAVEIWMTRGVKIKRREFNPYTGKDLGEVTPYSIQFLAWTADLHTNLLGGPVGRKLNGVAAMFVVLLSVTGAIIWWPGTGSWRRSLGVRLASNWKSFNWDLHSAVGIWSLAFVLIWGITGVYLVFPLPFERMVNRIAPLDFYRFDLPEADQAADQASPIPVAAIPPGLTPGQFFRRAHRSPGDKIVRLFTLLHFGTFGGWPIKALWVLLGLTPVVLFVTGYLMWWNRVLRPWLVRLSDARGREPSASIEFDAAASP